MTLTCYSRRIGHAPSHTILPNDSLFVREPGQTTILNAVKLSGETAKGLSVGVLQSLTATEYADLSDPKGTRSRQVVEPLTSYTVARVQQNYHEGNTILGGIFTSTNRSIRDQALDFLSHNAYTGGLDLVHHWRDKEFFVDARIIGSTIQGDPAAITALQESSARYFQRPGAAYLHFDSTRTRMSGYGARFQIGKGSKGFWRYSSILSILSPGLELNDLGYMKTADMIRLVNNISYFVNEPVSVFRTNTIGLEQFNSWDFNGDFLGSGVQLTFNPVFRNMWSLQSLFTYTSQGLDTRILRGGYDMLVPSNEMLSGQLTTDISKNVFYQINYDLAHSSHGSATSYLLGPGITVRPVNSLTLGLSAEYSANRDQLQYVTRVDLPSASRYILGTINQQTLDLTFRVDFILSPDLSLQYYGSPFVSRGHYSAFRLVTDPRAGNYNSRFYLYPDPVASPGQYMLKEGGSSGVSYLIQDPDFNFRQFRSNLVLKWEYRPGSDLYLVWSDDKTGNLNTLGPDVWHSFGPLGRIPGNNIFLIKFSYWFSL